MSTIPGGFYIGADGKAHDAHGKVFAQKIIHVHPTQYAQITITDDVIYVPSDDVEIEQTKPESSKRKKKE